MPYFQGFSALLLKVAKNPFSYMQAWYDSVYQNGRFFLFAGRWGANPARPGVYPISPIGILSQELLTACNSMHKTLLLRIDTAVFVQKHYVLLFILHNPFYNRRLCNGYTSYPQTYPQTYPQAKHDNLMDF